MMNSITQRFLGFTLSNLVVFYLAQLVPGGYVAFGNTNLPMIAALIVCSLILSAVVSWASMHIAHKKLNPTQLMIKYWAINTIIIYILARTPISEAVAIGIGSFWVAIVLGLVTNIAQYGLWEAVGGKKK